MRVQFLLNPDAEVKDIFTLTPTLSRRERVVYSSRYRLMPMGVGGEVDFPNVEYPLRPVLCSVGGKPLLLNQSANHQADHRDVDDGLARGRQVLIVLAEPALPPKPAEGALDNPSARKHFEPSDIVGSLDDFHLQPVPAP